MSTTIRAWLDNALLQSAAESYLDQLNPTSTDADIWRVLKIGVNEPTANANEANLPGATRFTQTQTEWFTSNYEIVTHYSNDATGFSCTLF